MWLAIPRSATDSRRRAEGIVIALNPSSRERTSIPHEWVSQTSFSKLGSVDSSDSIFGSMCTGAMFFYKQGEHDTVQTLVLGSSLAPAARHGKPSHNLYLRQKVFRVCVIFAESFDIPDGHHRKLFKRTGTF
uniref:hypothetical protein n=1 Tax=Escherichia coli TaxID=562 RepID=UPI001F34C188|nr:hypothetical protein [Escherichia coli]